MRFNYCVFVCYCMTWEFPCVWWKERANILQNWKLCIFHLSEMVLGILYMYFRAQCLYFCVYVCIYTYMQWCLCMCSCMFMYMYLWMHMHVCACRDLKLTLVSSWVNFHFSYWGKIFHWAQVCLSGLDFMYALGILRVHVLYSLISLCSWVCMFITYIVRIFENITAQ